MNLTNEQLVGKTVASVSLRPGKTGIHGTAFDPIIYFSDGSLLVFNIIETDGDYGVNPILIPKAKKRGRR